MSRIASSDLTKLIIGFLLTGVIGGLLTNYFTSRQKEVDRARAFQDKRSEILVAKIDEVFEQISLYEVAASRAYDNLAMDNAALVQNVIDGGFQSEDDLHKSDSPPARAIKNHLLERRRKSDEARALIVKARELAAKNRLWLGEQRYAMIQQFVSNAVELPQLEGTIRESPDISSRRAQLRRDFVRLSASAWDERAEDEPARCIDRK